MRAWLVLLVGCKVAVAPVTEDYLDEQETLGRTALGARVTYDGADLDGVSGFADDVAFIRGELVVTEAAEGPCARRLRKLPLHGAGFAEDAGDLVTCPVPGDPTFGFGLAGADVQTVTGDQVLRYTSADGRLSDGVDGLLDDGALIADVVVLDEYRTLVGAPMLDEVHAYVHSGDLRHDHVLPVPEDVGAGFGARLHASHDLLVVETLAGSPTFYAPSDTSWKHWELVDGPDVTRVLAIDGDTLLAELPGSDDLAVFRFDGEWTQETLLPGLKGAGDVWAFDAAAVFAARAATLGENGAVERYRRLDGALDGAMALTNGATSVGIALEDGFLAVAEHGEQGVLHVFDWAEERLALFEQMGGHHEEVCMLVDGSLADPQAFTVQEDGALYAFGDVDEDQNGWYRLEIPPHSGVDLELSSPFGSSGALDLHAVDGVGAMLDHSATRMEDGVHRRRWDNFGDTPIELFLQVEPRTLAANGCRAFDLVAWPFAHDPGYCEDGNEPEDGARTPLLIDSVGIELTLEGEETDVYEVFLEPGRRMRVSMIHDLSPRNIRMRLFDETGRQIHHGAGDVILRTATGHERVYVEVEYQDRAPGVCGTYVLDVDLTWD